MPDLVTLEEAKEYLQSPVEDDPLVSRLISRASAAVERYTGRVFIHTDLAERHDGGSHLLFLRQRPVVAVTRVTDLSTGITLAADEYTLDGLAGLLIRNVGEWDRGLRRWEVQYTAGFGPTEADVPGDVKQAVLHLVAAWYHRRDPGVTAERIGDYSRDAEPGLPSQVRELLAPYVEVVV
ncbi:head-tail connector protein [Caldinitratiruptor microaerophilus]|uniref:Phage gp6-like head-tail connector protein n=1 Tax=Caldinitratiruptor microaerophilus TaxID=671077 RepID=A0AA35G9W9_9FIRM|nr:hypothetical protein [Caldinitratiruptor microaerophilus]BDG61923.1 hypothetical protein caldi_30130 [Caldinitratiruptor microaerophilus]